MLKKLIVRRLIGGLLLAIFGFYILYRGINLSILGVRYDIESITSIGGDYIILGGVSALVGTVLASTSYMFQKKWLDYTLTIVETIGIVIWMIEISFPGSEHGSLVWIDTLIAAALLIISIPWSKNGYKEMPYNMKKPVKESRVIVSSSKDLDQITKLKQLLDANAITQEEFESKKKEILDRL